MQNDKIAVPLKSKHQNGCVTRMAKLIIVYT